MKSKIGNYGEMMFKQADNSGKHSFTNNSIANVII